MLKSILFKGTIKGNGIVNYDAKDQKWMLKKYKFDEWGNALKFDNIKIAKHALVKQVMMRMANLNMRCD